MEFKKIFLMLLIGSMLIGSACAAGVNDFKVNDTYKNITAATTTQFMQIQIRIPA